MSDLTVVIKPTGQAGKPERMTVTVPADATILQLKEAFSQHCEVPAEEQRMIYKGQILKDHKTLSEYGIADNHVVHMVKGRKPAPTGTSNAPQAVPTSASPPAGLFPGDMNSSMNQSMMNALSNNPELFRTMMQSNPIMQRLMETNPQLAQALNNPEVLRDAARAMSSPGLMQEQMRTNDVAMRSIENIPGGFDQLRRLFESTNEALESAQDSATGPGGGGMGLEAMLGGLDLGQGAGGAGSGAGGGTTSPSIGASDTNTSTGPNAAPLPNPWSSNRSTGSGAGQPALAGLLGAMGGGGPGGAGMGGMGMPSMLQSEQGQSAMMQMMQNPQMQQMVTQMMQNPDIQQMMLQQNPQMQAAVENNPSLREMMFSPQMLQASLQTAQAMANAGISPSTLQGLAGGGANPPTPMPGLTGDGTTAPGAARTPDLSGLLQLLGNSGLGSGGLGGPGIPTPPVQNPEETYATQLQQLRDMGFFDQQQNIAALQATGGNVNAAVERLLSS